MSRDSLRVLHKQLTQATRARALQNLRPRAGDKHAFELGKKTSRICSGKHFFIDQIQ